MTVSQMWLDTECGIPLTISVVGSCVAMASTLLTGTTGGRVMRGDLSSSRVIVRATTQPAVLGTTSAAGGGEWSAVLSTFMYCVC